MSQVRKIFNEAEDWSDDRRQEAHLISNASMLPAGRTRPAAKHLLREHHAPAPSARIIFVKACCAFRNAP
jgi:hypothetical protein